MEFEILYFLQGLHQPLLDRLMVGITSLGNGGWFWIALTVLFLCLPKYRRCGITMAVALVLNFLICNVAVKNLLDRPVGGAADTGAEGFFLSVGTFVGFLCSCRSHFSFS